MGSQGPGETSRSLPLSEPLTVPMGGPMPSEGRGLAPIHLSSVTGQEGGGTAAGSEHECSGCEKTHDQGSTPARVGGKA